MASELDTELELAGAGFDPADFADETLIDSPPRPAAPARPPAPAPRAGFATGRGFAAASSAGVARLMGNQPANWRPAAPAPTPAAPAPAPAARGFGAATVAAAATAAATAPAPTTGPTVRPGSGFNLSAEAIAAAGAGIVAPRSLLEEVTQVGIIERVTLYGDWAIAYMWTQEREKIKITGNNAVWLKEGLEYSVRGPIKHHSSGESLELVNFEPVINTDLPSIQKFIVGNYQNIGVKTAQRFLAKIKEEEGQKGLEALRQKLIFEPWAVTFESVTDKETRFGEKGSTPTRAPEGGKPADINTDAVELPYVERMLSTRFGTLRGLKPTVLKLLAAVLLGDARQAKDTSRPITEVATALLTQDPYAPIAKVPGYGFVMADEIGRAVNIPRDAAVRLGALAAFHVTQACEDDGHSFVSERTLRQRLAKAEPLVSLEAVLENGVAGGHITVIPDDKRGHRIYDTKLYEAEQSLAHDLHDMLINDKPLLVKRYETFRAKALEVSKKLLGYELDEAQIRALHGIATSPSRLHVVTAGPGCGKTAIMEVFSAMMSHKRFAFAAPTGKAAKVLTNRVERQGYTATTLNSLLKGAVEGGFEFDRTNPLDAEILVVDEGTMPELRMAAAVTAAMNPKAHLIVLGDPGVEGMAGQLPSIGPGRVMSDLLELPGVDHHHLSAVKRNGGGILDVVNQIRAGTLDCEDRDDATFSHSLGDPSAFFPALAARYMTSVAEKGIENVVLLMSRRAGKADEPGWNTTYANARLRELCNPNALRVPGTLLHVGDRIIIRENMTLGDDEDGQEIRVVNGDTGSLLRFQPNPDTKQKAPAYVMLKLDDGRIVQFPGDSLGALNHSYAMTVHSSQGSEYKDVLVVMTPGQPSFMNQNMFLTGASRPKERLFVFGDDAELRRIASTPLPPRQSALVSTTVELLHETLRQYDAETEHTPKQ